MDLNWGEMELLSKEEYVKGFRRLGDGGFAKCIVDYVKSVFSPKTSPDLDHGPHLKEMFINEMTIWGVVGPPPPPDAVRCVSVSRFLKVTIIDDPHFVYPNIFLIEDKKKTYGVLLVDDMDSANAPEFQFGTVLRIENPEAIPMLSPLGYFLMTNIQKSNSCTATVVGKKEDMCCYCLKENAERRCKECKRHYCGRECQEKDWKFQDHKTICKLSAGRFST